MNRRPAAINSIWLFLILISIIVAAYTGTMDKVTKASFNAAKDAVMLAISLIGAMALWLGIMKVAEQAGLTLMIARAIKPIMTRLFPDVPAEHPAMSAMIMNMAANMLGLGNAATPFGIKAMSELDKLNPQKGTATDSMCLFLAINTSSVTILPLGVIAVRAAAGASHPAAIILPGIIATLCSTVAAIVAAKIFARGPGFKCRDTVCKVNYDIAGSTGTSDKTPSVPSTGIFGRILLWTVLIAFLGAVPYHLITKGAGSFLSLGALNTVTEWLIPLLMGGLLFFGYYRGVHVYEAVTEGAKEGFEVAVRIIPFMVAIFTAIGMFRESGALDLLSRALTPVIKLLGVPVEVLPLALIRPLSGTGSFAIMSEIINKAPNGLASFIASVMQGCTETTFYVLAVYFGAVGVVRIRYALHAALIADAVGISVSVAAGKFFFGFFN